MRQHRLHAARLAHPPLGPTPSTMSPSGERWWSRSAGSPKQPIPLVPCRFRSRRLCGAVVSAPAAPPHAGIVLIFELRGVYSKSATAAWCEARTVWATRLGLSTSPTRCADKVFVRESLYLLISSFVEAMSRTCSGFIGPRPSSSNSHPRLIFGGCAKPEYLFLEAGSYPASSTTSSEIIVHGSNRGDFRHPAPGGCDSRAGPRLLVKRCRRWVSGRRGSPPPWRRRAA